jgi:uncharacterized protein YegL
MSRICGKCRHTLPEGVLYCTECGFSAGATSADSRTVLMQPSSPSLSQADCDVIASRVTETYGSAPMIDMPGMAAPGDPGRPEQLILIVDESGSMGNKFRGSTTKIEAAIHAGGALIMAKTNNDAADRVGVVAFNHHARLIAPLGELGRTHASLMGSLRELRAGGGTDLDTGLRMAYDQFDWQATGFVPRVVLLTDGMGGDPLETAEQIKSRGGVIDTIGIGPSEDEINAPLLRAVASDFRGQPRYRFISDRQTLVGAYHTLGGKTVVL